MSSSTKDRAATVHKVDTDENSIDRSGRKGAHKTSSSPEDANNVVVETGSSSRPAPRDKSQSCGKELVNEDGSLNWDIPCFAQFRDTPCWEVFKSAFSCIHYNKTNPAVECMAKYESFMECIQKHPELFSSFDK